jgi:hypothetical protein
MRVAERKPASLGSTGGQGQPAAGGGGGARERSKRPGGQNKRERVERGLQVIIIRWCESRRGESEEQM